MTTKITRRTALFMTLPLPALWAGRKPAADERKSLPLASASYAEGPADEIIRDYATMLKAYVVPITLDEPVVVEIDYIADETGGKDMPPDTSQWVRSVLERIGDPFETYRTWPSIAASAHGNVLLGARAPDRPRPPAPNFRVAGVLSGYKETLVQSKSHKFNATFGGGHTSTEIEAQLDKIRSITTLSVSLSLERPNGTAVRGTTVDYQIDIAKDEKNRSLGLYVGGSGMGLGSKLSVTQSTSDLLREAVAIAVVHMTGVAFQVPYYRSGSCFRHNDALDKTVRMTFAGLADVQIEDCIRRFLFLSGLKVNPCGPVTDADRTVIRQEMARRNLADDYRGRIEMAMQLWGGLDYRRSEAIVDDLIIARQREINNAAVTKASQPPPQAAPSAPPQTGEGLSAANFDWPPSARFVVLDLSGIADAALRNAVLKAASSCEGCFEFRAHKNNPALFGLRLSSSIIEVTKALKRSGLKIRYSQAAPGRLVVLPVE